MKILFFTLIMMSGFIASAEVQESETVIVTGGEKFNFIAISENVTCNGSGFVGVDLELLSNMNNVKVYNVTRVDGPITIIDCDVEHEVLVEYSKTYQSASNEKVIFILNDELGFALNNN